MGTTGYQAALDSNDLVMSYGKEVVWGTKPPIGFQQIRLDGEGFSSSKSRTRPAEINAAGQASASITTKVESTGSLNFSMSAGTFDDILASSLGGVWSAPNVMGSTTTMTATTIADSATPFATAGFQAGMSVRLTCNGTAAALLNLSTYKITAVAAGALTVTLISGPAMAIQTLTAVGYCQVEVISLFSGINTLAATAGGFTDSGSGFLLAGIQKGQMLKVSGFAGATINTFYRVDSVTAGVITTTPAPATTEAVGASVTIKGNMCRNGLNFDSYFFQKQMAAALFLVYAGAFPTGGTLGVGVGDYLKGSFTFLNQSEAKGITDASTGTATPAPTGIVIDSINGIGTCKWKNAPIATAVQKVDLKFDKTGAANQFAIGSKNSVGVRKGTFTLSGTLATYFKDFTLYDDFIAETPGPFGFPATDNNGLGYYFTVCQATIMDPKIVSGGPSQDVMASFSLEGNPDTTGVYGGKTFQIDAFSG